jgi:cytochrome P450
MTTTTTAAALADPDTFLAGPPYDLFRRLRDDEPVAWTAEAEPHRGFWSVTRHADIVAVSRDVATFTSTRGVGLEELDDDQLEHRTSMIDTDPPYHTKLRGVLAKQFTPRVVNGYESFLRGIVATTLDTAFALGRFDFVEKVSSEIPVRVLCRMMAVPDGDHARITAWGDRIVGHTDPELADVLLHSEESAEYRLVPFRSPAVLEVFDYGRRLQAARRAEPTGDLVTHLVEARVEDRPLTQQELDNYVLLLALAGQETTRQAITHAMHTVITVPGALETLAGRPQLLRGSGLEELLRWGPPVYHMRRTATVDAEIGGNPVAAGDKVVLWFPSGNRDERAIPDPDTLDLTRPGVDLLTFGKGGPHYCLGSHLARLEVRVTMEEIVARIGRARLTGDVERLRSNFVHGVKRMPIEVELR